MPKLKWLESYKRECADKLDAGEIEWRFDCFKRHIIERGLGYPSRLVRTEKDRTDIRVSTPEAISHIIFETKKADADLDKGETLTQAKGYLQAGESFLVLASPSRLRVFTPRGTHVEDIPLEESAIQGSATFWQLSHEFMLQKGYLEPFRAGKFDYCYIPVQTPDGFDKFIAALRLCGNLLLRYLGHAWEEHGRSYLEFQEKLATLNASAQGLDALPMEERLQREKNVAREERKLRRQYAVSIEVREVSFPAFQDVQPYSRDVESKELVDIYLADITYAALNRMLFVRIAEDKGLLERKISNGGIGVWRNFVTYLKDKYQDLLQVAYRDAGNIYEHFFEEGIFDWYVKSDSRLSEALENVLFLLNAFDLSQVDRDTLGDLYQQYLPARERKRLGEFYTPREVVDYILRHISWKGDGILLDPACGSGGFLVRAAHSMLEDLRQRGISDQARLGTLRRVVGLDINPFATHIAELNLLFLILDSYLKARAEADKEGKEFHLTRLPIHTIDSLLGTARVPEGGLSWDLFARQYQVGELDDALQAVDMVGGYDYLVMNPPYVRNERLPEEPRANYRKLFSDVAAMNADIFTYFMKKAVDWLKEGGMLGVIVSLGLADARANDKLRKALAQYTIERIVPLEWCDVFVSNVNPMLLFIKKAPPPKGHKLALVHGIASLEHLDQDKGEITYIEQERWLALAPDGSWRVEVREADLPILEKMRQVPTQLDGQYGMTLRGTAQGRTLISDDPNVLEKPYPILDGREVKAWSIEWQRRFIDYQPQLISDPKTLEFFKAPKVVARRISLTTQAAVDEGIGQTFLARDTVMVVRSPVKALNDYPYVMAALMNSLPLRYYAFLMLRGGVIQQRWSTFYPRVIGSLPTPEAVYKDGHTRQRLEILSHEAHQIASEIVNGDRDVLNEVDSIMAHHVIQFAHTPGADLSGYVTEIDLESAQVSDSGELTCEKLGVVRGDPAILQYIISRAPLEGRDSLSNKAIEAFPVPQERAACIAALEAMQNWAVRKPGLAAKLQKLRDEIDDLVLSAFNGLTESERAYIRERANQSPLKQVLVADQPGAPTKVIPVKYWETGERYKQ